MFRSKILASWFSLIEYDFIQFVWNSFGLNSFLLARSVHIAQRDTAEKYFLLLLQAVSVNIAESISSMEGALGSLGLN